MVSAKMFRSMHRSSWSLAIGFLWISIYGIESTTGTNEPCKPSDVLVPDATDPRNYAFCNDQGIWINETCPEGKVFDAGRRRCVRDSERRRIKRQTMIVGTPCQENVDCQTTDGGAYCDTTKKCDCLSAYINLNGYCWPKKNPGETCAYQDQCIGASPNSYCDRSGVCKCTNNQPPALTDDGTLCLVPGECPTNQGNPKLREAGGSVVRCDSALADCFMRGGSINSAEDAYYCMCPSADPGEIDCSNQQMSYCCPRRAMSCIQPKDEGMFGGGGQATTARWWYNSASSNCEPLAYRGAGGNANNFQTKAFCETYCKTACPRGNPAYDPSNIPGVQLVQSVKTCSVSAGSTACPSSNYYCLQGRTTFSMCCPTNTFICSTRGGIGGTNGLLEISPNNGDVSYYNKNFTRWYFDGSRCQPFSYYGSGGNFNNFHTEAECRDYCASAICPRAGEPLRDNTGDNVRCDISGTTCPAKYTCSESGYCCPSVDFICSQPQAIGGCSSFAERYWFNPNTRSCQKFSYSGCQGNFNNFETYKDCTEYCGSSTAQIKCPQGEAAKDAASGGALVTCSASSTDTVNRCPSDYYCYFDGNRYGCCPTRAKTCAIDAMDPGTACITPVTRWYYNSQSRQCEVFTYNGCDGNSNNFATKIDCQDYCGVGGCPDGGEPFRDTYNGQYRICGGTGANAAECPIGHTCSVVTMGTQVRRNHCCPTREFVCAMNQDAGVNCGAHTLSRYFYNSVTGVCELFTYNGCGGNRNNFDSLTQCYTYCNSAGCQAGQVALPDPETRSVITCQLNTTNTCPSGYSCVYTQLQRRGICCGSSAPAGACPIAQSAYMDSFTNTPLQCQPNVDFSCPNGIFCQHSFTLQNSFCCQGAATQCPQGGTVYVDNDQPRQCTPGLSNVCPSSFTCQQTSIVIGGVTSSTGYCCGQPNVCGPGFTAYIDPNTKQPVTCVQSQLPITCPTPYACRPSTADGQQSYCCAISTAQTTNVCASGKSPPLTLGVPTLCSQSGLAGTGCPIGFNCDLYSPLNSYYCCGFGGAVVTPMVTNVATGCPPPSVLLQPIQTCSPGLANSCPMGFFCSYDSLGQRYVCCGSTPTVVPTTSTTNPCPNTGRPYVNPATGQPQICILGSAITGCPAPFGCSYSMALRNYYCCGATGRMSITMRSTTEENPHGCPIGDAYLYPRTKSPLACRPNKGPPCPRGYSCQRSNRSNTYQCCSTKSPNTIRESTIGYRG